MLSPTPLTACTESRFLTTLRSDGAVNEEAMSPQILEELFGDKQGQMEANVQEQEQLLFQIKVRQFTTHNQEYAVVVYNPHIFGPFRHFLLPDIHVYGNMQCASVFVVA